MCYSAQITADYRQFCRQFGAVLSIRDFVDVFWRRRSARMKLPKAIELLFANPQDDDERAIKASIDEFGAFQSAFYERELFKQRKRLADAERILSTKPTKAAAEHKRIATSKVDLLLGWLGDLKRTDVEERDLRFFPNWYAPLIVMEQGQRVAKLMRYQCRPAGKPAFYDLKFPGTYNARRDSLGGFWKAQFGHTHGLMVVSRFFENVSRDDGNVVLEFSPEPPQDMLMACLWSRWTAPGEPDLLSFAAITDDPPPEIAAAGHDRCIVPIKPEHVDAWLNPQAHDLKTMQAILDDRPTLFYEHRLAA